MARIESQALARAGGLGLVDGRVPLGIRERWIGSGCEEDFHAAALIPSCSGMERTSAVRRSSVGGSTALQQQPHRVGLSGRRRPVQQGPANRRSPAGIAAMVQQQAQELEAKRGLVARR